MLQKEKLYSYLDATDGALSVHQDGASYHWAFRDSYLYLFRTKVAFFCLGIEYEDVPYQDAINNLECVLELVHMIYVLKTEVVEIFKYPIKDNDIKKFSNHLVECSVVNFLYKTWYEISHTKYVLTDIMNGKNARPSVDVISDDTDDNFKMF